MTVLVIDDHEAIRRAIRHAFGDAKVLEAATAREGIDIAATSQPDLIILDLGLPDRDGIDVCREVRAVSRVPLLVLSARHGDDEKVRLLDAGADDYLTKPFSTSELQARARALLRRAPAAESGATVITIGELALDLPARALWRGEARIHLTPTEWGLTVALMRHAGRTLTHQQLFREVWRGRPYGDAQQYLRVYVAQLRRKIERDAIRPRYIVTEPGVGYRFSTAAELASRRAT